MSDAYRVDLDRLADIVDQIDRFTKHVEAALDDIDTQVGRLHTTWAGAAAAKHQQAYEQWVRGMREMGVGLLAMRRNAEVAHTNYVGAATANASMWRQAQ